MKQGVSSERKPSTKKLQTTALLDLAKSKKSKREGRKPVDRGSLYDFFDSKFDGKVYHPEPPKPEETPRRTVRPKTTAVVRLGKLTVDEKVLKQECAKHASNSWFFMNSNSTIPDGVSKKVRLFDDSDYTMEQFRPSRPVREKKERIYDFPLSDTPQPVDTKKLRPWSAPSLLLSSRKDDLNLRSKPKPKAYLFDSDDEEDDLFR